jgi:hypothetical protein
MTMTRVIAVMALLALWAPSAHAADLGVAGKKLVIVDAVASGGKAKVVYVSEQGVGVEKGMEGDSALLDATFEVFYTDTPSIGARFDLPPGGWLKNKPAGAKYLNKAAPSGGGVKAATVTPTKVAKVLAQALGEGPNTSIDLVSGGAPSAVGGITTVLTIHNGNDGTTHRMCTRFSADGGSSVLFKEIAGGSGRKLVAKNGQPAVCGPAPTLAMEPDQPGGFLSMPWPNDIRVMPDGSIDLTGYPGTATNALLAFVLNGGAAKTFGFGTNSATFFQTTALVDGATVPSAEGSLADGATVMLVNLDDPIAPRIPLLIDFRDDPTPFRPGNLLALLPYPGHALDEETRYAAIVFEGVHDATGRPLRRAPLIGDLDEAWDAGKPTGPTQWAALRAQRDDVFAYVDQHTDWGAAQVVGFTVFTTQNATGEMQAIAAAIADLPPPTPVSRTLGNCSTSGAARATVSGVLNLPTWQAGTAPFLIAGGEIVVAAGKAVQQATETVDLRMTFPCGPAPAAGWPILLFMDGTGAFANSSFISELGGSVVLPYVVASIAPLYGGDRAFPGQDPGTLFFNYLNSLAGRTNQLQQAADMIYLRRVVEGVVLSAAETDTAGPVDTDDDIAVIAGHSQGALTIPQVLAVDPAFDGGFISSGGGGLYQTVVHRGDTHATIDGLLGTAPGEIDQFHPFVHAIQTLAEVGDAANYARLVTSAHVLSIGGRLDGCSPLEVVTILGTGLGAEVANPLYHPFFGAASLEPASTTLPAMGNLPDGRTVVTVQLATGHFGASTNPGLGFSFVTSLSTGAVPEIDPGGPLLPDFVAGCPRYDPLP